MGKRRLDTLLAERGLFPSRSRAAASVMAGEVRAAPAPRAGSAGAKPGELVDVDATVTVAARARVRLARRASSSRTRSLPAGLEVPAGARSTWAPRRAASPTACSSAGRAGDRRGRRLRDARLPAAHRSAGDGDGAHQRAHAHAQALPRAACRARRVARRISRRSTSRSSRWPRCCRPVLGCLARGYDVLALVKPQFEVGRGRVGKGGVVRDGGGRAARRWSASGAAALELGAAVRRLLLLGAAGAEGQPRDLHLAHRSSAGAARASAAGSSSAMAREVEP